MNDHIAKPIHVDEPLLISKKNCNYSVATVKVLNSYEKSKKSEGESCVSCGKSL